MSKKNSSVILKEEFKDYKDLNHIYSAFSRRMNFFKKKVFLIAVSGGPDSLALAALAKAYNFKNRCKIYYALVDHNLRSNSSKEAQSVKKLLKKHQIKLTILKNKMKIINNVQSKAREVRYDLLTKFCKQKKIKTILTAHNLEDQVETFFIRLSRGSGLQGLSSMKEVNKITNNVNLSRPLLDCKKKNLIEISKIIFGKYYKDPTNKNIKYFRTRIRNLQKTLEKIGINYDQIFKSIKNLSSSRDTLNLYFSKIYKETVKIRKKEIFINLRSFNKFNQEMKMRVFKQSIKDLTNSYYSPRSKKISNLIDRLKIKKNIKFTLGGCIIFKEKDGIMLKREAKS